MLTSGTVEGLLAELQALLLDGWTISDDDRGEANVWGNGFNVAVVRDDASVQHFKDRADAILARPKMTPAERMAKARDARGSSQKPKLDVGTLVNK